MVKSSTRHSLLQNVHENAHQTICHSLEMSQNKLHKDDQSPYFGFQIFKHVIS